MRGGYLHNDVMARGVTATLERLGARVWTEHPVGPGRRRRAVDVYAEIGTYRVVCEIELGPGRAAQDVRKAEALGADVLLIVTPTASQARAVKHRLRTITPARLRVHVLPFGLALNYLSELSPVDCGKDKKSVTPPRKGETDR